MSSQAAAEESRQGIFPDTYIAALAQSGGIAAERPLDDGQIQPASLDLRLGEKAYRLRASFLPGHGRTVLDRLDAALLHEIDIRDGAVLETGCVYLVPLLEHLALPAGVAASANPKSSTGRLDIFTRVIADGARQFDKIPAGYHGPLYLEISPRLFPILVRCGSRLSQIRFRRGHEALDCAALKALQARERLVADSDADITGAGLALSVDLRGFPPASLRAETENLIGYRGKRHSAPQARESSNCAKKDIAPQQGLHKFSQTGNLIGYRGKRHSGVVDVDRRGAYAARDFWEPIFDDGRERLILDPDEFYILASREAVHVPPLYAAEMTPFDPLVGEFRVHYAGFFDPGFGAALAGGAGARAVLEVRSHEVPFILEHGQIIGRLVYEPMLSAPEHIYGAGLHSHYQAQGLKLSKHFK